MVHLTEGVWCHVIVEREVGEVAVAKATEGPGPPARRGGGPVRAKPRSGDLKKRATQRGVCKKQFRLSNQGTNASSFRDVPRASIPARCGALEVPLLLRVRLKKP